MSQKKVVIEPEITLVLFSFVFQMLLHCSGIVLITLVINSTTMKPLLKILGLSEISDAKRVTMSNTMNRIGESCQHTLSILKTDRFLADADWGLVTKSCVIANPYAQGNDEVGFCFLGFLDVSVEITFDSSSLREHDKRELPMIE